MNKTTIDWTPMLADAGFAIFLLVGVAAVVLGLTLLFVPAKLDRLNAVSNRRFSLRLAMKPLEVLRYQEDLFYRHHKWTGGLILAGALFFFFNIGLRVSPDAAAAALPGGASVWSPVVWALIGGNLIAAIIGATILIRPAALKPIEAKANRWVSTRRVSKPLDEPHDNVDRLAKSYPRTSGALLLISGVFLVVTFTLLLVR